MEYADLYRNGLWFPGAALFVEGSTPGRRMNVYFPCPKAPDRLLMVMSLEEALYHAPELVMLDPDTCGENHHIEWHDLRGPLIPIVSASTVRMLRLLVENEIRSASRPAPPRPPGV